MESNNASEEAQDRPNATVAGELLSDLEADRDSLAALVTTPRWLYPALGAVLGMFVASPTIGSSFGFAWAAVLVLLLTYAGVTRIRRFRLGWRGMLVIALLVSVVLVLLSTSLGLVALGLNWWTIAPALLAFVITVLLGWLFDHLHREDVRHGR